jgi:hypothetical protein
MQTENENFLQLFVLLSLIGTFLALIILVAVLSIKRIYLYLKFGQYQENNPSCDEICYDEKSICAGPIIDCES